MSRTERVYIDTSALMPAHMSGIGHAVLSILITWQFSNDKSDREIVLLVPFGRTRRIRELGLSFKMKMLPMPAKGMAALRKFNLMPPLDLICGKGTYVFFNYWNTPLLFSKSLTYIYDVSFLVFPEFTEPRNRKFLTKNLPKWIRRTSKVITISNHAKSEILRFCNVDPNKVEVSPLGVNSQFGGVITDSQINSVKQKYHIEKDYILFAGNIEPRKNLSRLVTAYSRLIPSLRDGHSLVLVGGDGWNNEQILRDIVDAQTRGIDIRKIDEYVSDSDLVVLYKGAKALVHPALYEGFGLTVLESLASGTPVACSDLPSLKEIAGEAALYFDPLDLEDMAKTIERILSDGQLRRRLVNRGIKRAQLFSWRSTVRRISLIIDRVSKSG